MKPTATRNEPQPAAGAHGLALYAQVASRLRSEIAEGLWALNARLPTVAELAQRYEVAVITIRQALHVLKGEGLVTMDRGRGTFVVGRPPEPSDALRDAINDPLVARDRMVIHVLETQARVDVPAQLHGGAPLHPAYHRVRKIHLHDGEPFCAVDLYVASEFFRALPRGAEGFRKINALLAEHFPGLMAKARTWITVAGADFELAQQLACPFGAPTARVRRRVLDAEGRVVYAGLFRYRGDRFIFDFDSSQELPTSAGPRAKKPRKGRAAPKKSSQET